MGQTIRNKILYLSFLLLLGGCSVYKGSFDCPAKKGIGCESVSKVNELINDDRLDEFTENLEVKKKKKCACNKNAAVVVNQQIRDNEKNEEKITIYFNQYQEKGILHKKSEVEVGIK